METVKKFDSLLSAGKYEEASGMLCDDFSWTGPNKSLDKAAWLGEVGKLAKDAPTFEAFEPGTSDLQVTRKGKKKVAMMTVKLVQAFETTEDGKIKSINTARV